MTNIEYRQFRGKLGYEQPELAALLGVARETVVRRESGAAKIGREAELAIRALPKKKAKS